MQKIKLFVRKYGAAIIDALRDPETGHISLTRTGGISVIVLGASTLMLDVISGVIIMALGIGVFLLGPPVEDVEEDDGDSEK